MKEFVQTLNHVYNKSYRPGEILPDWFQTGKGSIICWHISHLGHQSGAMDMAKKVQKNTETMQAPSPRKKPTFFCSSTILYAKS